MGKGSKRRGETSGRRKGKTSSEGQAEALLEEAAELLANQEYEHGIALLREAHALAPTHLQAAEMLGSALAEFGDPQEAAAVLRACVALSPNEGFEKYMYLGQLLSGAEAMQHQRHGIALLEEAAAAAGDGEEAQELHAQLAAALCSLAEGLLAEAAPAVDAVAEECRALLARAVQADPSSPEPLQALAGLRQEQGASEEALALLRQSLACWLPPAADAEGGADAGGADAPGAPLSDPPSLEFRIATARLLLDLDDDTVTAVRVLEGLLEECDDNAEVWFLLALAHHGACSFERARNCLAEAEELVDTLPAAAKADFASEIEQLRAAIEASTAAWKEDCEAGECEEEDEEEDGDALEE